MQISKKEFLRFMKRAVDRDTREYQELYFFLLKTFMSGDVEGKGVVTPEAFDIMIEEAAASPRRFGLAPSSEEMFKSKEVRNFLYTFERC